MDVGIIGLGLIGGSLAKDLSKSELVNKVYGIDINKETLEKAKQEKTIDYTNHKLEEKNIDIIFICLYPKDTIEWIKDNYFLFKDSKTLIVDFCGLQNILDQKLKTNIIKNNISYISMHPMAGRELSGYKMAKEKLFKDKSILYSIINSTFENEMKIIKLMENIGFGKITKVNENKHDEIISYTSQLPHIISVAYMNSIDEKYEVQNFTGGSFEDLTRIAAINENLWSELFLLNQEKLIKTLDIFADNIEIIKQAIIKNNEKILKEQMNKSRKIKLKIKRAK